MARTLLFRMLAPCLALGVCSVAVAQQPITITILHTNDMHARVEGTKIAGKSYGGYARLATLIQRYKKSDPNPILLNAGDTFQGTMYFNVYEGLADLAFMNYVGFQAMVVGNHEFDKGPAPLATFAKQASFPLLAANIDVSNSRALDGLIRPSTVIDVGGAKVGIVGAVTADLHEISSPGEDVRMLDLNTSVQRAVDGLTQAGINKIILLTHVGYEADLRLAAQIKGVDVVVGGHSHTPLGTPKLDGFPEPVAAYPMEVKGAEGQKVLVVQGWDWGKVLGRLRVRFDRSGKIETYMADRPIVVDESVPEDPTMRSIVAAFQKPLAAKMNEVIGEASSVIGRSDNEASGDHPMGRLVADAMLARLEKLGVVVTFANAGGVRAGLESGPITYGAAVGVQPFGNSMVTLELTGTELLAALEQCAAGLPEKSGGVLFPSRGSSYTIDSTKAPGQRISNVMIAGQALDQNRKYRIGLNAFTAQGGDGLTVFKDAKGSRVDTGEMDIDVFMAYIKANSPIKPIMDRRVQIIRPPFADYNNGRVAATLSKVFAFSLR
ncbi:MAG: 5'-nucleotidase C-terminal domain-containing protein [Fimbriimonadaceae bacterium]|nr:5'-nucleotidase C-terminal domain-containing protein [Fimbriimonadaceae bacterium]